MVFTKSMKIGGRKLVNDNIMIKNIIYFDIYHSFEIYHYNKMIKFGH